METRAVDVTAVSLGKKALQTQEWTIRHSILKQGPRGLEDNHDHNSSRVGHRAAGGVPGQLDAIGDCG